MESKMVQNQIYHQVVDIIDDLPKDQKEVLVMRIYNDLSFQEISENTGASINTVLGRMRYALINMRKIIAKKEIILTN
jgi:RNA polymerase sigma-70 factor (ECF subfamily)